MKDEKTRLARRSFLSRFGIGATVLGAGFGIAEQPVAAQAADAGRWQAARHAEDDWLDQVTAKHKYFMDTTTPGGVGQAIFFANNYYTASRSSYGLTDADNAVVIGVRHQSTAFAYDDAMWAKYGVPLAERAGGFLDPKTNKAPIINVYQAMGYGPQLSNSGVLIDAVTRRGMRFAVCQLATRANATLISQRIGGTVDDVYKELTEHLVPNGHMVPAGIVAFSHAQERGYSSGYVA